MSAQIDGLEAAAIELWHRFANEGAEEWCDETHKSEYRLAAQAVIQEWCRDVRITQEMLDAGASALLSYRKSGGDYRIHPTHAVEAAINAALARVKGA